MTVTLVDIHMNFCARTERCVMSDAKAAASKFADENSPMECYSTMVDAFLAGVEWQKKQVKRK
jgi:hypothetical protein